ncbi:MAG: hypothetical protein U1E54_00330 [Candidatus Levybacteria bacterium]|nr:hypothetical protein [Candidatus Levybacteria bacterium]
MSIERGLSGQPNFVEMFGGVQPSRGAVELVKRAISLGENPTALTQQAGRIAQKDGRNKVGFFGAAEQPLSSLKDIIASIERNKYMEKSYGRRTNGNF